MLEFSTPHSVIAHFSLAPVFWELHWKRKKFFVASQWIKFAKNSRCAHKFPIFLSIEMKFFHFSAFSPFLAQTMAKFMVEFMFAERKSMRKKSRDLRNEHFKYRLTSHKTMTTVATIFFSSDVYDAKWNIFAINFNGFFKGKTFSSSCFFFGGKTKILSLFFHRKILPFLSQRKLLSPVKTFFHSSQLYIIKFFARKICSFFLVFPPKTNLNPRLSAFHWF